jgi:hypothetical protein
MTDGCGRGKGRRVAAPKKKNAEAALLVHAFHQYLTLEENKLLEQGSVSSVLHELSDVDHDERSILSTAPIKYNSPHQRHIDKARARRRDNVPTTKPTKAMPPIDILLATAYRQQAIDNMSVARSCASSLASPASLSPSDADPLSPDHHRGALRTSRQPGRHRSKQASRARTVAAQRSHGGSGAPPSTASMPRSAPHMRLPSRADMDKARERYNAFNPRATLSLLQLERNSRAHNMSTFWGPGWKGKNAGSNGGGRGLGSGGGRDGGSRGGHDGADRDRDGDWDGDGRGDDVSEATWSVPGDAADVDGTYRPGIGIGGGGGGGGRGDTMMPRSELEAEIADYLAQVKLMSPPSRARQKPPRMPTFSSPPQYAGAMGAGDDYSVVSVDSEYRRRATATAAGYLGGVNTTVPTGPRVHASARHFRGPVVLDPVAYPPKEDVQRRATATATAQKRAMTALSPVSPLESPQPSPARAPPPWSASGAVYYHDGADAVAASRLPRLAAIMTDEESRPGTCSSHGSQSSAMAVTLAARAAGPSRPGPTRQNSSAAVDFLPVHPISKQHPSSPLPLPSPLPMALDGLIVDSESTRLKHEAGAEGDFDFVYAYPHYSFSPPHSSHGGAPPSNLFHSRTNSPTADLLLAEEAD